MAGKRRSNPLSRREVIDRLRTHAARTIIVTKRWLAANDPAVLTEAVRQFGTLSAARRAAAIPEPSWRWWTPARIAAQLRNLHAAGHRLTGLALKDLGRHGLFSAIYNHVGSMPQARRLARVPEPVPLRRRLHEVWDATRIVVDIQDLAEQGASIARTKVPRRLASAGVRHFGSWDAAVEAAGFNSAEVRLMRPPYTRTEVIALLRKLVQRHPGMSWVDLRRHPAGAAMSRLFGSLQGAVRAAEIAGWPNRKVQQWNRQRVIDGLRHSNGKSRDPALIGAATTYFGSVPAARAAAGLPQLAIPWSKERVLAELRAAPRPHSGRLRAACVTFFGSTRAAHAAAGLTLPRVRTAWTEDRVLAALRAVTARGVRPATALTKACGRFFGSVAAARMAAQLPPLHQPWTEERVIAELRAAATRGAAVSSNLLYGCQRCFGTLAAAKRAAGVAGPAAPAAPRAPRRGDPQPPRTKIGDAE